MKCRGCMGIRRGVGAFLLVLWLLHGCSGARGGRDIPTIKVGVIAPFSGDYAELGEQVRNGVVLAAEAWNSRGGVLGKQVQLVLTDSQCAYAEGRAAAVEAIDQGALFIIGAVCAVASEGVAQVAGESDVLQITPSSVNLDLTLDAEGQVRPFVFRVPAVDPDQGTVAAQYALAELGANKAGILYAQDSVYGLTLTDAFRTAFVAGGGEVVEIEVYDQDAATFYESLEGVRDAEPDVLYLPGYHDVMNRLVSQARRFGLLQPILGSDGWHAPGLDLRVVDGAAFTTHFYSDEPAAGVRAWVEVYETRYMREPGALAAFSYDTADLLFTAIARAGIEEPVIVAQTLETLTYTGISGELSFDSAHNPVRSLPILRVQDGRLTWVGRYAPALAADEVD